ncbi:MAG: pyrroline-5-carboxylate reductase [Pseudomonadota bacterium]
MTERFSMIQIGAGSMGGALLKSWVASDVLDLSRSAIIDPSPSDALITLCEAAGLALNPETDGDYDVCVLAVKPQVFGSVLPELDWPSFSETLFISIAAGISTAEIAMLLKRGDGQPKILRTMPSLPALVGRSMTLLAENAGLSPVERQRGESLMAAAGTVEWTKDEDQLDRLMGVSGCAPAFFLRAVEGLIDAAIAQGASPETARRLAEETFVGTAALLDKDTRMPGTIREAVTSPGGTTAAGLAVLEERGFADAVVGAVEGAYQRAKELRGGS